MKKIIHSNVTNISLLLLHFCSSIAQQAVISVPIADLVGQPMVDLFSTTMAEKTYANLAVYGGPITSDYACPRLHQLLYNDTVEVIKYKKDEVYIRIAHAFYITQSSTTPQACYWTLKNNITLLDTITEKNIAIDHIPEPIHFSDKNHTALNNKNIITLTQPHHDTVMNLTFSAGTRFIGIPQTKKRGSYIPVFAIDYATMQEQHIKIPTHKCMIYEEHKTKKERISDYVNLLTKWSHQKNGFIPYVWGGTSFVTTTNKPFVKTCQTINGNEHFFYQFKNDTSSPKNGFDCSGLITRATQICAIPYFCKNTTTITQCLEPLNQQTPLAEGDLILIRGHVMMVSNIQKNLLIEARAYGHGYGKLHEIPIKQVFENVNSYKDLLDIYYNKKSIKRKDSQGVIQETFNNVQLFSIESAWKET